MKAIICSGYSEDATEASHEQRGFDAFLQKPYDVGQLRDVLGRLLP